MYAMPHTSKKSAHGDTNTNLCGIRLELKDFVPIVDAVAVRIRLWGRNRWAETEW